MKLNKGVNTYFYFLMIFAYLVLISMQGLDMMDEGFHVVLYQQIFNDPVSIQYGLVYWLTVVVGGLLMKLTAPLGLWGIRLCGVGITTFTILMIYRFCRRFIPTGTLQIGLLFIVLLQNADPKNFYYNNFSSFLYNLAAILLFDGLTGRKWLRITAAGFIVGINMFTRITNILGVGMCLVIILYLYVEREKWSGILQRVFQFIAGVLSGISTILLVMYSMGHLTLFFDAVRMLFPDRGLEKKMIIEEGGYVMDNLVFIFLKQYLDVFYLIVITSSLLVIFLFFREKIRSSIVVVRRIGLIILYLTVAAVVYRFVKGESGIYQFKLIGIFIGTSVVCSALILTGKLQNDYKLIFLLGLFILIVQPLGSFMGIYFVAPYSLWLIFPFTIDGLIRMGDLSMNGKVRAFNREYSFGFITSPGVVRNIKYFFALSYLFSVIVRLISYPYVEDMHSRIQMRFPVKNSKMGNIYTSKDRALAINELLFESKNYIRKNDRVLAYEMMPMYNYWTDTRPYIKNPCPWYYTSAVFSAQMREADSMYGPPYIVIQKVSTMGEWNGWPENIPKEDYSTIKRNEGRKRILQGFLDRHHYCKVWENDIFSIMKPGVSE